LFDAPRHRFGSALNPIQIAPLVWGQWFGLLQHAAETKHDIDGISEIMLKSSMIL
jgi:hypothetical protein